MTPEALMQLAIESARAGIAAHQSPFGCAIARGETILAAAHNTVIQTIDITAHAEINALRQGCRAAGQVHLERAIVATTCEPCPMCMSALHWARVDTVYFGATIADAAQAGFNELIVPAVDLLAQGGSRVQIIIGGVRRDECARLFDEWLKNPHRVAY
jgi:tRNA(Arg) A34 adenosine deaminase TadA